MTQTDEANQTTADAGSRPGVAPTFVLIGSQRCGSSWIHKCLEEHPEIFVAEPKELHFFGDHWDNGVEWYLDHFKPGPEHTAWGEATPKYIAQPEAAERLKSVCPDARLITCFRHPVERAYSIYQLKRNTDMQGMTFEQALEQDEDIWWRGRYAEQLEQWWTVFPKEQILALVYDDLLANESTFIRRIYEHIGVDSSYTPSWLGKTQNAVVYPGMQDKFRKAGLGKVLRAVRNSPIGPMIREYAAKQKRKKGGVYKEMLPETRQKLVDYYRPHNAKLGELLGCDLSNWDQ